MKRGEKVILLSSVTVPVFLLSPAQNKANQQLAGIFCKWVTG
jgi:hypothetical protein